MAFNIIENITIDDNNTLFGGFVYKIDYQTSAGEGPSTVKITLVNEKGEYFIEPEDLRVNGTPTTIKIGSKLILKMFPVSFRFENSSAGRLLEVEYIDESVYYLDKFYIGLNNRQAPYENVILLGSYKYIESELGISLKLDPSETSLVKAPEVLYTWRDLLTNEKIKNILGEFPEISGEYDNFYKSYVGTLRQVFSAWANDLGFLPYWENSKINFIDLRNPDNYKIIKQKVDALLAAVTPESLEESYSIRDTFARGINSNFIKDGEIISDSSSSNDLKPYYLANLNLANVPGFGNVKFKNSDIENRMKAIHYGKDFFLASLLWSEATGNLKILSSPTLGEYAGHFIGLNPSNEVSNKKLNTIHSKFKGKLPYSTTDYIWVEFAKGEEADFERILTAYKAMSDWQGRFFYLESPYNPEESVNSSVDWFHKDTLLIKSPFNKYLSVFGNSIPNYETITIEGIIKNKSGLTYQGYGNDVIAKYGDIGYYIKEIDPEWFPSMEKGVVALNQKAIILEVSGLENFVGSSFVVGFKDFESLNLSNIKFPSDTVFIIYTKKEKRSVLSGLVPFVSYYKTDYPEWKNEDGQSINFASANVMSVDVLQNTIPEEFIGAQSQRLDDQKLSEENFLKAHELYKKGMSFYQSDPFFSKTFTLPFIDLPEAFLIRADASQTDLAEFDVSGDNQNIAIDINPSIRDGLQSLSISVGSDGVKATYTFGTENFKIRSSEFYIENYYDSRRKEVFSILSPKIIINRGHRVII